MCVYVHVYACVCVSVCVCACACVCVCVCGYPDEERQEALKTKKDKTKDAMCDMFYGMHVRYKEWLHEQSKVSSQLDALEYFKLRMNCKRDMRVICDRRRLMHMSLALHEYAMEITAPTAEDRRQYLRENTENDYSVPLR
jgi:hypothetical protein